MRQQTNLHASFFYPDEVMVEAHKNTNEIGTRDMKSFDTISLCELHMIFTFSPLLVSFSHERASPDLTSISCSVVVELLGPQIYISVLL